MFGVLLYVFSRLWQAVAESGVPGGYAPERMIWYLVATEWITLSVPLAHLQIEEEVRRGDVAYSLLRPASYLGALYAQALGRLCLRLPFMAIVGLLLGAALSGGHFPSVGTLVTSALLGVLAQLLLGAIFVLLGVCAFWLGDVLPIYWVTQKLLFVLGGLMLPLELYPELLRTLAAFTPFPSVLNGPAGILLHGSSRAAGGVALRLVLWLAATALVTQLALARAARRMTVNGG
jgi:ABC-2 type transport system permease protein